MSNAAIVADTLRAWREAERLLDAFPPGTADHETARLLIAELRTLYAELTDANDASEVRLRASDATIKRARAILINLEIKQARGRATDGRESLGGGATGD